MLTVIYILLVYITLINAVILLALYFKKGNDKKNKFKDDLFVSVVVAFKNESKNIDRLINSLSHQTFPVKQFEIILVDDFSSDGSFEKAKAYEAQLSNLKVLKNKYNAGKKGALKTGILNSRGEYILLTDADCFPGNNWMQSMISKFDDETDIVFGYALFKENKSFLNKLCRYENLFSTILMESFYNVGYPYLVFGRNISYRKSLFNQLNGFDSIEKSLSGDDDLFFQKALKSGVRVLLNDDKESIVFSECVLDWKSFFRQKSRHVSASKFYPVTLKAVLSLIYGSNILLNLILIVGILTGDLFIITFILINWFIKFSMINFMTRKLFIKFSSFLIPILDFLYFLFLIPVGIRSRLKIVHWK